MQAGNAAGIGSEPGVTRDGMTAVIERIATPSAATSRSRRRFRRAADVTALRLGRAVLAYLGIMVGIITLAPFRFASAPVHGLSFVWTWPDLVLNVLMFAPVGFVHQLTRPRGAAPDLSRVFLLGLAASGIIEVAQLFSPLRYPSLFDLATNSGGAVLGAAAYSRLSERLPGRAAVQRLALELPLMGLVYLLVPLCWLIGLGSEDESRRVLVLGPALMAGVILGAVHAAVVHPAGPRGWLVGTTLGWSFVALVPGGRGDLPFVALATAVVVAAALCCHVATRRMRQGAPDDGSRRFEVPTLRRVLPVYAAYLALSALWPLGDVDDHWRGTLALTLADATLTQATVFRALEQVAAFTLVGYMAAEFRGRDRRAERTAVLRVLTWSAVVSALLQGARGFQPATGASLVLFLLCQVASVAGCHLYTLQRDHVLALLKRQRT